MSNKIRYSSSVAIMVPVCWVRRRDEIKEAVEDVLVDNVDEPGRYRTRDDECVILKV